MTTFLNMLFQMAPYLLLGFMMAGVLHVFVPTNFFEKHLSKENFKSVLFLITLWALPADVFGIAGLTIVQKRVVAIFAFAILMWVFEAIPVLKFFQLLRPHLVWCFSNRSCSWN